jgi:NAD-dependent SIR2 family protein deacetylase
MHFRNDTDIEKIAHLIQDADAIAIFAGAGMGVDSGLEQYRGEKGLWKKSILLNDIAVNYYDLMQPVAFKKQPELAWGLIGFLMEKYDKVEPHRGFSILKEMVHDKQHFVVTSNIDEHFQKAGFNRNRIFEIHGSIYNSQCMYNAECEIWETEYPKLESQSLTASPPFPMCPECNSYCRPNIYLFEDDFFVPAISADQQFRYMEWQERINRNCGNVIAIEIGAGKTISTLRRYAEKFAGDNHPLIRINLNDFETNNTNHISVPFGALDCFVRIENIIDKENCPF